MLCFRMVGDATHDMVGTFDFYLIRSDFQLKLNFTWLCLSAFKLMVKFQSYLQHIEYDTDLAIIVWFSSRYGCTSNVHRCLLSIEMLSLFSWQKIAAMGSDWRLTSLQQFVSSMPWQYFPLLYLPIESHAMKYREPSYLWSSWDPTSLALELADISCTFGRLFLTLGSWFGLGPVQPQSQFRNNQVWHHERRSMFV